jgi:hypothetical protein
MSELEAITNELKIMADGVDKAHQDAAAAHSVTEEVIRRTAALGFGGIAQALRAVLDAIAQMRGQLSTVTGCINDAARPVAAAPKEVTPQQTIAVLLPAMDRITAARGHTAATISQVDETKKRVLAILEGGQPGRILAALDAMRQTLVHIAQRADTAKQRIAAAVEAARKTGDPGN